MARVAVSAGLAPALLLVSILANADPIVTTHDGLVSRDGTDAAEVRTALVVELFLDSETSGDNPSISLLIDVTETLFSMNSSESAGEWNFAGALELSAANSELPQLSLAPATPRPR